MRNSFEFKECERFLKRVLKDRGMFTKGAVIAFLITGGIGFVYGVPTVDAAEGYVKGNPHSGGTTIDYNWATTDLLAHESVVFAPIASDTGIGTTAERFQGIYNRNAYNSVIIGGHAWAAGSNLSRSYITNPGTYRPTQQTVIGNNATGIGGQATAVGSGTFAMDQATAVGNDVMAMGASSIAIGNDDISEKYKDTMTDDVIKSIYGDPESTDVDKQGIFKDVEFIDSTGTKRKRTSLDPSGYNTLRSWDWFKKSYSTIKYKPDGVTVDTDTHIYSPTMARGIGSISIGSRSIAQKDGSTAIGTLAFALGEGSTAMGLRAYTGEDATGAVAIGEESRSFAAQSLAVGNHNESSEQGVMSYGYSAKAAGIGSLAIGYHTYANTEFGTNAGAAALISGVQGVNAPLTTAQQTAWDNYVAKASAYYTEVEKYPKDPDVQGTVVAAKTAMDAAYTQLTATGFSVPNVANLTYISDGQAGNKNKSTAVTNKINALQTGAANIDTKKGTDIYLTTKNSDGTKNEVKKTVAKGANSIAIGYYSVATANSSIAQGAGTVAEGGSSIALGSLASTTDTATNSISIGVASSVKKENSIALGTQSSVYGAGSVALGAGSRVYNTNSMAMGYGSTVMAANSSAIGVGSKIDFGSGNAQAIGTNAVINKNSGNSLAFGNRSTIGENSVNTVAQGFRSTIGTGAHNSMAIGAYASIGDNAKSSFAMGTTARVAANAISSMALGEGSSVTKDQSIALGRNASADFANSVALGFQSTTHYYGNPNSREASLSTTESATNVHGLNVGAYLPEGSKLAGKLAKLDAMAAGYVSVGGWTEEVSTTENGVTKKENVLGLRRIVNVAPGALDTDAVTVAQLRDWTDKTAHFLSISGASGKSKTDFATENWTIAGKDSNGNAIGTLHIKGNFENEGAVHTVGTKEVSNALAVGAYANAMADRSVAIADHAVARGTQSVSIGQNAFTLGENSTAMGSYATAAASNSIAMGVDSTIGEVTRDLTGNEKTNPNYKRITAVGRSNQSSIAIGFGTNINADRAIALGVNASVVPVKTTDSTGNTTYTEAHSSIAIGQNATVTGAQHSIALGENSEVIASDVANATTAAFTGETNTDPGNGVLSVGSTNNSKNITRRIIHVSGGSDDYDAVNVKQLKAATAYYSVNTTDSKDDTVNGETGIKSNRNNDGATGVKAVAIGSYTSASGEKSIAFGREVLSKADYSVGVGTNVSSNALRSVAIGSNLLAEGKNSIAIGAGDGLASRVEARGQDAIAIGTRSKNYGISAVAIGRLSQIGTATTTTDTAGVTTTTYNGGIGAVAIGNASVVNSKVGDVAIGYDAKILTADNKGNTEGTGNVALGYMAKVSATNGVGNIALGYKSEVTSADIANSASAATKVSPYLLTTGTPAEIAYDYSNDKGNGVVSFGTRRNSTDATTTFARRLTGVAGGINDYDAVNVKQLKALETNERHIKAQTGTNAYKPDGNGDITLNYVNGRGEDVTDTTVIKDVAKKSDEWKLAVQSGTATTGTAVTPKSKKVTLKEGNNITLATDATTGTVTISAAGGITSVTSGNTNALTVSTTSGAVTVTPVLAAAVSNTGDANKLVTAGVVKTAIDPLATRSLNNITDDGKKVITGLGPVVAASGSNVTVAESTIDNNTGTKKYTVSVTKDVFASGTNTTKAGTGTATDPYKYNLNAALTGMTSVTAGNSSTGLTLSNGGAGTATDAKTELTINKDGVTFKNNNGTTTGTVSIGNAGINAGNLVISNVKAPTANTDAANKKYVDDNLMNVAIKTGATATPVDVTSSTIRKLTLEAGDNITLTNTNGTVKIASTVVKDVFADGTNTTKAGTGTAADPYKYNLNTALTGMTSIAGKGGTNTFTVKNGTAVMTFNDATTGKNAKAANITVNNINITGLKDAALNATSTDAVTGKQLKSVIDDVAKKSSSDYRLVVNPATGSDGKYTADDDGNINLKVVDASNTNTATNTTTVTIENVAKKDELDKLKEAKTIIFVDADGDEVFKQADGTFKKANKQAANGDIVTKVNTTDATPITNVKSIVEGTTVTGTNTDYLDKLNQAVDTGNTSADKNKTTAVNVSDLQKTASAIVKRGLTFQGNDGNNIKKALGETLNVVGEGTYTAAPTTAAGNIYTKQNNGKLEIGLAKDLQNIASITNTKSDGSKSTKLELGDDELKVTNTQGTGTTATKTTVTIGKDGINAGGKDVTAVNEVDAKTVKANTVTVGKANSSGTANDGEDGKVTVTGKNGSTVELNGATGGLTLTTVNGTATNTISIKTKEGSGPIVGEGGAAAPANMSRLVYTTKVNGTDTDYEVATMKDGMKYAGDDVTATDKSKVIAKKLNETVDIVGGAITTNLTTNNIGVVNDNGKLNVRLSKVVTGMTSITAGKTVLNTSSVTVFGTGTVTSTLDASGTKVTDGATNGKTTTTTVDGLKIIDNTKGAQFGADLVRVNGTKGTGDAVTGGIAIGNQTVTATKTDATTEANTGNYITGLDNKVWDLDTKGYVSGRAATEDQLKVLSDKISSKSASDYRLIANPTAGSNGEYTLSTNGEIELKVQDASNPTSVNTIKIKNVAKKDELDKLKEAKALIYVDANGDEVFKQSNGTFTKADGTAASGTVVTKVNANTETAITNVKSIVENTAVTGTNPDYVDKLNATVADATNGTKNKATAVNVSDLQKTAAAIIDRGITFQGNDGKDIKKGLGQTLNIVGEGNYGTPATAPNTAAGNIFIKENGGNLEIGLAKELKGITSITAENPANGLMLTNGGNPTAATNAAGKTDVTVTKDGTTFTTTTPAATAGGNATTATVEMKNDGITKFEHKTGTTVDHAVTIDSKTGTITTGNTVLNPTSVTVSGAGTTKTTLEAGGTTVTDGTTNGKKVETTISGTTITDGTKKLVATATGITISPSTADNTKSVSLTQGGLNNGGNRITDVADPTANTDAANKQYVDARTKLRYKGNTVTPDVAGVAKANHEIDLLDGVLNIEGITDEVVTTASKDGKITVGLAPKVIKKLDQLAATTSDGRDSKLGSEANAIASTGIATADGINGKNVTYKVNALRHGEAGSVVFTDEDGNRLVKATDGKYYKATDVDENGVVKTPAAGVAAPVGLDLLNADKDKAYSSLVSPDGKTTGATSVLNNVGSVLTRVLPGLNNNADKTKFLDKLEEATKANSKVANAATNVSDLKNTADAIIAKGIDFKGNTGNAIHKNLGETLNIVGEGTAPTTTAANNIATKRNANGDLEIGLAKDLQGITLVSNTNDTTKPSSKMELTDDGVTLTNTQPVAGGTAETSKATIGKDGKTTFENSTAPNNTVEIDSKEGTITVGKNTDKQVVVNGKDGKITTGKTEVNGSEVIVKDGKNFTKINTGGTTITNGTNTTVVGPNGITITPSAADHTKSVTLTDAGLNNGGNVISNVADPVNDTDAANKQYVDARTKLRYKADTTVDDAGATVVNHEINLLDGTLEITGTADKVVTKATKDGKINIDLADAVKKKLDQLDAKNSDGRDGKTGNETGAIAKDGLTKADGLNEKTTTYKVNALRHGEAGSVVYTDDEGHRLVKAVDGKYHRAEAVNADGTLKVAADLPSGVTPDAVDNPQARVVNVDGTTTSPTVFGNVASPVDKLTAKDDAGTDLDDQSYLNKLRTASKTNASKFAAVNATDLYTTAKEILAKGMNFVGNDTTVNVHRDLGATLKVQGTENHTRPAGETANTTNILVKANAAANGDGLNISLAKDLQGITSITNTDGTKDATGTKLEIGNDGLTVTNTQAGTPAAGTTPATPATTSTMTVGKDGKTTFTNSENPNNAIEINSKDGTITAGTTDDKKVTINGKDGKITTGHTEVNGTSVSVTDDHNNKTETTATGTTVTDGSNNKTVTAATGVTVTDGNNNKTVTAATGVTVTDGTNTASYTATSSKLSDGANKSVETTASGTTITNGNVTTTATAGNTVYKDGNNVTTVNTDGMKVTDGTATVTHSAGSSVFTDGNNSTIYSASGSTIVDDHGSATHTATGSTFTEGNNTASHTATGSSYDDGTNHFELGATGIRINSDNGGSVSINSSGLNNGGNTITHVGDGVADTDAVNVKQLKANKISLTVNDNNATTTNHNLVLTPSTDAKDKHTNYDVKLADTVTLGTAANAVTVDGTNGTIKAGKDANAVTVDGTKASITAGKDDKAVTVDGTKASITAGKDDKAVTVDGTKASITAGKDDKAVTVDGTKATLVVGGTGATTDSANKVTINGTDGIIKTGNTKVSGSAVTITDTTNGTQVGATLIRVNGAKAADGTVTTDGIAIGHHADVVTSVATATKETGNFITGLDNTKWDPKTNGIVSGRAATEDQLKVVDDKVNKGRVFSADTLDANKKPVEAMVGLGDTLSIKGGADMTALTDNNIGVELKAAETKDGVTTPTTMTVKLAKKVNMADGSTTYTKYVTDKAGKKYVRKGTMDGNSVTYTLYNLDKDGNIAKTADNKDDINVSTSVSSGGIVISPHGVLSPKTVTLSNEGLNNGGNRITNVADGVAMDDAATVGQLKRSTTTIINHANTIGAHAAALAAMNPLSFDPMRKSQVMAGIGSYRGKQALALGVAHYTSENFIFNIGMSVGHNEHMMNAGMTYRFGGNPSMIPDRYKGGPISSIYVMQDELSAFKEENARQKEQLKELPELKQEVAELRAMVQQLLAAQGK